MKFTYYGHSCFLIDTGTHKLLFDPFISPNDKAAEINIEAIQADYILVSHGHEDHVADLERLSNQTGASIISNFEIVSYYGAKGIDGHPMNHGGSASFPFGLVKMVNAIHSSVLPDGTYGGNPAGFIVQTKDRCFYYAGDTALTYDMKLIPEMGFELDFAILPIGDNFTMGPDEAVKAAEFIQCKNIIGVHFDTFGYIEIDHSAARRQFENQGNQLHLLEIGQSVQV